MKEAINNYKEYVGTILTLGKSNDQEAQRLLTRVVSLVKPVMKKRGWKVGKVMEFYPQNPSLLGLNVNHGQEIKIKLRRPNDEGSFLDLESLVGTMLHELTHIVQGPHDQKFYKILDELTQELEGMMNKGWQGEGFDAPGTRVGQGTSHNVDPIKAKAKALEAAEKRRKLNSWQGGSQKLGGSTELKGLEKLVSPREMAVMAAERRAAKDRIWCGSDETKDSPSSSTPSVSPPSATPSPPLPPPKPVPKTATWTCPTCTLVNPENFLQCDACLSPRNDTFPKVSSAKLQKVEPGWYCPECFTHMNDSFRMCSSCKYLRIV